MKTTHSIPEEMLHFLWQTRRFEGHSLVSTRGELITVIEPGTYNHHAGPDFLNARIKIDDTLWVGHVEMHVRSSDWHRHRHNQDPAYRTVVLHVVWEEDEPVLFTNGERLPALELRRRVSKALLAQWKRLQSQTAWVPCQNQLSGVPPVVWMAWLDRLSAERLELKALQLEKSLLANQCDWEATLFQKIAWALGLPANGDAMETLTKSLPLPMLARYQNRPLQIEAFLFGQSGLLESSFQDAYPLELKTEFQFLRNKHLLQPMSAVHWKFSRMRPSAFPTLRIAQLAALLTRHPRWFGALLESPDTSTLQAFFEVSGHPYWGAHYRFDQPGKVHSTQIGPETINRLLVNVVAPMLFLYGYRKNLPGHSNRALNLLEALKPEDNQIIRQWKSLGCEPENTGHSQALLHLKKQYCDKRQCLRCAIGQAILKG
jgi:hypothetical protein